jgi:LPXTG-motif cell wall-anchored protein
MTRTGRILKGLCAGVALAVLAAGQQKMPGIIKKEIRGNATVTTELLWGTVVNVQDGTLVVKMAGGDIRMFNPPASRKFIIDGQELSVGDLKPGTRLSATVTTTTTPITERITTVGTGMVWFVSGNNVILTLPNNENRQYKVKDDYKFMVDGKPATVFELRKGMTVSAEKIVEAPRTEIANDVQVTGTAPKAVAKAEPAPAAVPAPAPVRSSRPGRKAEPKLEPAPALAAAPAPVAEARAARLPKTGSPIPLIGALGLLCMGSSLVLRKLRRG